MILPLIWAAVMHNQRLHRNEFPSLRTEPIERVVDLSLVAQ